MAIHSHARTPLGRLSRASEYAVDTTSPTAARRLRDAALRGMASPEWGTELGRLFLAGELQAPQYLAGKRWARTVALYHEAIGANGVTANQFERVDPAREFDLDSQEGQRRLKRARQAIVDMRSAHATLRAAGALAERAVRDVCEADSAELGWGGVRYLRDGLDALVGLWGLNRRRR